LANIGLPNIFIAFSTAGTTAIQRGERGIVALILKDAEHNGANVYTDPSQVPQDYSAYNLDQINKAWMGGVKPPIKVIVYVEATTATDYSAAESYLEGTKWDYLAVPGISSADATTMATWIKELRDSKNKKVKAVLPNTLGDHEGIINFATDNIVVGTTTYHTADYCARIAGILAGTPLQMSATYEVLSEVTDVPHLTTDQFNTQIGQGQLLLMNDGEKVKIARAVNSLQTTTATKNDSFKKIKIVDISDQIHDDITSTIADSYIGKVPNIYSNKVLLITAIKGYFNGLVTSQLIDSNPTLDIDMTAQKTYLQSQGIDLTTLNDQQIKEYNTGDNVFLAGTATPIDAMEDIALNIAA
jgi:hypothetical protein